MLKSFNITPDQTSLEEAIWIDLLSPSKKEEKQLEKMLGFQLPTREKMIEIELSSRLYKQNGIYFMTTAMLSHSDTPTPKLDPVTFVLTPEQLITIRYTDPQAFVLFTAQFKNIDILNNNPTRVLVALLDTCIDRLADILELVSTRLDECSKMIFTQQASNDVDYRKFMQEIGSNGDLNTKARESLITFSRLILFLGQTERVKLDNDCHFKLDILTKDINSLNDHAGFLSTKINFLLDATLGMVNIEQNKIIKIFSVAAVIFLPPTLVASIYGMNFRFIPELTWKYGYVFALAMIVFAAWLPYRYFKYRRWL